MVIFKPKDISSKPAIASKQATASSPPNLKDLAARVKDSDQSYAKKVILFGSPGSGKTHMAATLARVPSIKRIFWFDGENGLETVIYAKDSSGAPLLSPAELEKIIPITISDTKEQPAMAVCLLKALTASKGVHIEPTTGEIRTERDLGLGGVPFNITTLGAEDAIVIDSLSQLADSVLALSFVLSDYKDRRQNYGDFTLDMGAIVSGIQATKATVIACTHELPLTKKVEVAQGQIEDKLLQVVPLCGSRAFSAKVGKYFAYKIYCYTNGASQRATCKLGKIPKVLVARRRPISFEGDNDPSLEKLFLSSEEEDKLPTGNSGIGIKIKA